MQDAFQSPQVQIISHLDMGSMLGKRPTNSAQCSPGRFFASNMVKLMLAVVLMKYDVKTRTGVRPENWEIGCRCLPDWRAEILFKQRSSSTERE